MKPFVFLAAFVFGLSACQPKGSLVYRYPTPEKHEINRMVVVIDYLNLRDDVGKYWDYDSYYHQKILNQILAQINIKLKQAGYPKTDSYLLTSGLLIKNAFAVEHYIQDQLQADLLYPPYTLASYNMPEEHISSHNEFLGLLVKYIAQRRHHETDEHSHRGMQMGYHFESLELPSDSGILYVHINHSAPGIIKQLGALLISGAVASQADYAHVGINANNRRQANAFLVHQGSGQILWKNHSTKWTTDQPLTEFLTKFPVMTE